MRDEYPVRDIDRDIARGHAVRTVPGAAAASESASVTKNATGRNGKTRTVVGHTGMATSVEVS